MKIALIGYGKMGKEIERCAIEKKFAVSAVFDENNPVTVQSIADAEVCIDFSVPSAVVNNIKVYAKAGKNAVIGTTGWLEHLDEVTRIVRDSGTGLIYTSNFSIGVNMFYKIIAHAAELMNSFSDYDAYVHELHHNQKVDSPSGTALSIAKIMIEKLDRKKSLLSDTSKGKISADQLHITSTRIGSVPGTHTVGFDSPADSIELTHTARNRSGFALGALFAARWIQGKGGVYTMKDALK
ncbi:4-hydroxy-tetrahydrodipicolinate reductase [bacterium]|nr:4-hydroxy-tetrahydrodipicolinate reductase [bacterium]